jgi:predicted DsbA family dithiol-disulfide isomerase
MTASSKVGTLSIISDTICPWCFIGKRRLEAALPVLRDEGYSFDIEWRPYQLNPDMPDGGLDREAYRTAKVGSLQKSEIIDAQMAAVGNEVGIPFRFDRMTRTPNTLASHVMIADARRAGGSAMQDLAVEGLFQAYFVEGRDIGDAATLREIAADAGFNHGTSVAAGLWELVAQEDLEARTVGISGVPTFLLNGHYLFSGARPTDAIIPTLREAADTLIGQQGKHLFGANQ